MDPSPSEPPVIVVGAGIVGVATAIWLQREGRRVVLVDRGAPGVGASFGNGGVLASSAVVPVTVPGLMLRAPGMLVDPRAPLFLRWRHLPRLAPWLGRFLSHATAAEARRIARALVPIIGDSLADHQALAAGTGAERFVVPCDYYYLYRDRADFVRDAFAWTVRRANGFAWDELDGAAFRAVAPGFAPELDFAVRLPGHGRISDPGAYVAALAEHVRARGGDVIRGAVEGFATGGGRVTGVRVGGATLPCSGVVLAAGAWSGALAPGLGAGVPLETERGYHLELWGAEPMPRAPVMIAAGKFVATPMEGRLRLAGIVEFGGLTAPASRAPAAFLRRSLRAAMPGIRFAEATEWMGHRPTLSDSLPVIGRAPALANAWLGFGHHHVGLTGGPRTGRLLAQLIAGRVPNIDLAPYAASRFQ